MPDGDKIPVGVYGRWRKVFKSLDARDSVERVVDAVAGAVAFDVRRSGGLVGLGRRVGVLQVADSAPSVSSDSATQPPQERAEEFTGAVALALEDHLALTSSPQATYGLAQRIVERWARSRLDRMAMRLVGDKKYGAVELYARFRQIFSDEQIGKLVRRILRHPTGVGLRAPNKRLRPLSLKDLLDTDLESLE
jgi:hypothetical protein